MYQNIHECLRDVYRFGALRIEPMGNTAQVCAWLQDKGVSRRGSELSQAEWHANAAMIQARIGRLLNRFELAAVECEYGKVDLYHIVDLTVFVEQQNKGVNLLLCDALLENLFTGRPKITAICDKYNICRDTAHRQRKKVSGCVAHLLDGAMNKLQPELERVGVLYPANCSGRQL